MNSQQPHHQPLPNELFSGTSQIHGDENGNGSGGVQRYGQISHSLDNVDHYFDKDVSYHYRYF